MKLLTHFRAISYFIFLFRYKSELGSGSIVLTGLFIQCTQTYVTSLD